MTELSHPVIPGRASSRESGIQKSGMLLWIPGSRTAFAPRNDGKESHHD
jgi:hypothetical protein